ncbi:MAG: anti-sigma factor domain-containing protein [Bacteroidia bacterium]
MDIQEYISSGMIESYVLGQLSPKEIAELQALAQKYPEITTEIIAVEESLMSVSAKKPPARLKQNIRSRIDIKGEAKVIPMERSGSALMGWVAAASIIMLIGSAVYNFVLLNKIHSAEEQLTALNAEKDKYAKDFEEQSASYQQIAANMSVMMDPMNKKVMLKGMGAAPNALAAVYWNQNTKHVMLNVSSLPAPAENMQYQLWAIVDGKPVDAGVFDMDTNMFHEMKIIPNAQAFAVTLEKRGGSDSPTMDAMYLMGNV